MRKKINSIICFILIIIILICSYGIYNELNEYKISEKTYEDVVETAVNVYYTEERSNKDDFLEINWDALNEINPDIIGWIYCSGTELNYPILKSKDNNDYIHKTVTGIENSAGSIFLDCRNNENLLDYNSIIYGHNMRNGSMFKTVNKYKNEEFYREHPVIHIYSRNSKKKYNVIAAYATTINDPVYIIDMLEKDEYCNWLEIVKSKSSYDTGINVDSNKRTITLSTCNGQTGSNKRFVLLLQEQNDIANEKIAFKFN